MTNDSNTPEAIIKQEREAARAEKVTAMKRRQATDNRVQRIGVISAIAGAVAIVAIIVTVVVTSTIPKPDPDAISIEGLTEFPALTAVHVGPEPVDYEAEYDMNPPAGGDHFAAWLNCGIYDQPQQSENAVHSLEHGAVWVTYDPDALGEAEVQALRDAMPSTYAILSPYPGLPSPVVASAWGVQVALDGSDDERLDSFIQKYWQSAGAPEPGAPCTGALDGPGKLS